MPNVIVNSCYIKSSQHYINYLWYAGEKLEAQTLVLNDGTRIELDPDELYDISETADFRYIQLEMKDGRIRRLGFEKYQEYVSQSEDIYEENEVFTTSSKNIPKEDMSKMEFSPVKYIDYIAHRPSVEFNPNSKHGLFGINGAVNPEDAKRAVLENENSIKWSHIISLTREGAEATGYDNRAAWENLIRAKAYDIGKLYNIPPEHLNIYAAYHNKGHHPHCHLFFFSNQNSTKEGCAGFGEGDLAKKSEKLRSLFNNEIFKDDVSYLKEERVEYRRKLRRELNRLVRNIGAPGYKLDNDITKRFMELAETLCDYEGRPYYQYLNTDLKKKVNELLKTAVFSDKNMKRLYDLTVSNQRAFIEMYNDDAEKISSRLNSFEKHFFEPTGKNDMRILHNELLQQAIRFNAHIAPCAQNENEKAKFIFSKEAKKGFENYRLGKAFLNGINVDKDINKAIEHFEKAAELENEYAQYRLGKLYLEGKEVDQDLDKAIEYLEKAAAQNNQFAQYALGALYCNGELVPKDTAKGLKYLKQSAEQGNEYAKRKIYYVTNEDKIKTRYAATLAISSIAYLLAGIIRENARRKEEEEQEKNHKNNLKQHTARFAAQDRHKLQNNSQQHTPISY